MVFKSSMCNTVQSIPLFRVIVHEQHCLVRRHITNVVRFVVRLVIKRRKVGLVVIPCIYWFGMLILVQGRATGVKYRERPLLYDVTDGSPHVENGPVA